MLSVYEFLSSLYQYFDKKQYLYLWTLPDRKTTRFTANNLSAMADMAAQLINHDVYFGLGATSKKIGRHERPKNEDIIAIPGLWIDIDIAHPEAHKVADLPHDIAGAMDILPSGLSPSMVIWSGYGIHVYWLFREPWEFDTSEERENATKLLRGLQAVIKQSAARKGWKIDTTADLTRVLRLPGTINRKIPHNPVPAQVIERSYVRYNPSDIEYLLPPVVETNTEQRKTPFKRMPTDGPAGLMLRNCVFLQHCQLNAGSITYDEWLAALTNIVRAADGIEAAHYFSALDNTTTNKRIAYNEKRTLCDFV